MPARGPEHRPARLAWLPAAGLVLLVGVLLTARAWLRPAPPAPAGAREPSAPAEGATSSAAPPDPAAAELAWRESRPLPDQSAGWETDAAAVIDDLAGLLRGGRCAGSFAEARAEAIRADLALFPPPPAAVRRLLLGGSRERALALVALGARPPDDDALVALALRTLEPGDDPVIRLLGAELVAALPPERIARNEEDVVRAFEHEANPLALAVALPGLEHVDGARLTRLLRAQLAAATPEMQPVLLRLAASRVGRDALGELEAALAEVASRPP